MLWDEFRFLKKIFGNHLICIDRISCETILCAYDFEYDFGVIFNRKVVVMFSERKNKDGPVDRLDCECGCKLVSTESLLF